MYKAYRLQVPEGHFKPRHVIGGEHMCSIENDSLRKPLSAFILEDGNIDGGKLSGSWFPEVNAEVFISHSHADTKLAHGLAGWMFENFGIYSFIDSTVWGHYAHLLEQLCKAHAPYPSLWESYKDELSPHVHLMLASALSVMMDKTECVIFIHSENSVIHNTAQTRTRSPWLLHEVQMMRLLRQRSLMEHRKTLFQESHGSEKRSHEVQIHHPIDLTRLLVIRESDMLQWELMVSLKQILAQFKVPIKPPLKPLDWLYENITSPT
ncbi:MAG: hypothetical protein U1F81_13050 [Verrucomicrobiaceae bacterium]